MRIFDKVWEASSQFTESELGHLRQMERTFLVQALWGTALCTVDNELTEDIYRRLLRDSLLRDRMKAAVLKYLVGRGLARIVSKYRQHRAKIVLPEARTVPLMDVFQDVSSCFDTITVETAR